MFGHLNCVLLQIIVKRSINRTYGKSKRSILETRGSKRKLFPKNLLSVSNFHRTLLCWMVLVLWLMLWVSVWSHTCHRSVVPSCGDWTTSRQRSDSRLLISYPGLLRLWWPVERWVSSFLWFSSENKFPKLRDPLRYFERAWWRMHMCHKSASNCNLGVRY